jgi:hypothetical protein
VLVDAVDRQAGIEAAAGVGTALLTITEPTETATAAAFAHTALLAGRPENAAPLAEAGRFFGRLAHLLDAVEDREADAVSGAWNPLTATGTGLDEARRLCEDALHGVRLALREAGLPGAGGRLPERHSANGRLAHMLLVHELRRSVDRAFGTTSCAHGQQRPYGQPPQQGSGKSGNPYAQGPQNPYGGGGFGGPGGGPGFGPGPQPKPRGFLGVPPMPKAMGEGCAAFIRLCCTCRLCCAEEYEGPWSRKKREGCCRKCDCDCDCCCPCDGC